MRVNNRESLTPHGADQLPHRVQVCRGRHPTREGRDGDMANPGTLKFTYMRARCGNAVDVEAGVAIMAELIQEEITKRAIDHGDVRDLAAPRGSRCRPCLGGGRRGIVRALLDWHHRPFTNSKRYLMCDTSGQSPSMKTGKSA